MLKEVPRYIYKLTFPHTGKIYIGQTGNPERRLQYHYALLCSGKHPNKAMQKDFTKYKECPQIEILENCGALPQYECSRREWQWMIKTKSYLDDVGYNGRDNAIWSNKTNTYTKKTQIALYGLSQNQKAIQEGMKKTPSEVKPVELIMKEACNWLKKVKEYLKEEEAAIIDCCGKDDDVMLPDIRRTINNLQYAMDLLQ